MKGLKLAGLITGLIALSIGYIFLDPVGPDTGSSAAGAAGLVIMFVLVPALGALAIMVVPTSIALLWNGNRLRANFHGMFWHGIWAINGVFTLSYLLLALYCFYIWIVAGAAS
ncbi:hypothetical protein [Microbulbifer sp. YPW16]|uniref:hypothetical protein n=1 Tax=Microbulbifer sp. YPW16 TaxID=2904242 RepID=UPI001E44DC3F|nr:hypothetical protein [Microbulbifer sp. YPW16]UHQ56494.1 hypothetical protein LVE68_05835 [Microbulbifer sp. YPW16]